jgi:hypothetical protein
MKTTKGSTRAKKPPPASCTQCNLIYKAPDTVFTCIHVSYLSRIPVLALTLVISYNPLVCYKSEHPLVLN